MKSSLLLKRSFVLLAIARTMLLYRQINFLFILTVINGYTFPLYSFNLAVILKELAFLLRTTLHLYSNCICRKSIICHLFGERGGGIRYFFSVMHTSNVFSSSDLLWSCFLYLYFNNSRCMVQLNKIKKDWGKVCYFILAPRTTLRVMLLWLLHLVAGQQYIASWNIKQVRKSVFSFT